MLARVNRIACRLSAYAAALLFAAWCLSLFFWVGYDGIWNNFEWEFVSMSGWVHLRVTDVRQGTPTVERLTNGPPGLAAVPARAMWASRSEVEFPPKVHLYPSRSPSAVEADDGVVGFIAPHWILAGLASVAPVARWGKGFIAKRRREWVQRLRICGRCGYDLRASADRCPECGEPFA
ncbi:MAG: hypothetical protein JWN51_287 [Phycisphaerales bacterium]|nr:hypothetical protein [Phycisphaerales bacterium]